MLVAGADHEPGDVLDEQERESLAGAQLDEVRPLLRALAEQDAVVRHHAHRDPLEVGEPGDQGRPVARLELVQPAAVQQPRQRLPDVLLHPGVPRPDAEQLLFGVERRLRRPALRRLRPGGLQPGDQSPQLADGVPVVLGEVVGDAGALGVHPRAAQFLRGDRLPGGRLHQRRAAQVDRPRSADDDRLVAHGRDIGAAGGAHPHHRGELGDAFGAHHRLVAEDPPEVLAVGEDFRLQGQERSAAVHQVNGGQAERPRDLLRPEVLFHRERVVGAALHRGVVGRHHHQPPRDRPHSRDQSRRRGGRVVALEPGERPDLQERGPRIGQQLDPLAHREFPLGAVALPRRLAASPEDGVPPLPQDFRGGEPVFPVRPELVGSREQAGFETGQTGSGDGASGAF